MTGAKGPVRCLPLPHLRGQTAEVPHGDHLRRRVQPVSPQGAQPPHEPPPLPTASPAPPTQRVRRPKVAPPGAIGVVSGNISLIYIISSLLGHHLINSYLETPHKWCTRVTHVGHRCGLSGVLVVSWTSMSKITRRCAVRDIAPSTHVAFTRPNPSTLPSWVSTSVSNRLMVLVLAAGLSGPPRRPTITRIVGSSASRSASLVSS